MIAAVCVFASTCVCVSVVCCSAWLLTFTAFTWLFQVRGRVLNNHVCACECLHVHVCARESVCVPGC